MLNFEFLMVVFLYLILLFFPIMTLSLSFTMPNLCKYLGRNLLKTKPICRREMGSCLLAIDQRAEVQLLKINP